MTSTPRPVCHKLESGCTSRTWFVVKRGFYVGESFMLYNLYKKETPKRYNNLKRINVNQPYHVPGSTIISMLLTKIRHSYHHFLSVDYSSSDANKHVGRKVHLTRKWRGHCRNPSDGFRCLGWLPLALSISLVGAHSSSYSVPHKQNRSRNLCAQCIGQSISGPT